MTTPTSAGPAEGAAATPGASLAALVARRTIIVCCGSGGVGKTTTAAVLAAEAAGQGRRAVVVTIDPARRLADALGLDGLTNEPTRVQLPAEGSEGELWAVMLDTKRTFDHLVGLYAPDAAQAERIMSNRFYRNISAALSGTQEYMAAEKLYELHDDERFDLVVVDTPPTRNALDFLEAPGRLTRFLDHRIYRALTAPTRVGLRVVNVAAQAFLRTLSRVVGGDAIADAVAFFQAFDGMEEGFRQRASAVDRLLKSPETAYVLITAPRRDTVAEARYFARRLGEGGTAPVAVIVNRIHPRFPDDSTGANPRRGSRAAGALAELRANLAELDAVADGEATELAPLTEQLGEVPMAMVPLLATDVHDLAGMAELAHHLFDRADP
ncbi:MAG TPA: ArsA-related P-loop ATPase [Acidimicrobiales bacterium]